MSMSLTRRQHDLLSYLREYRATNPNVSPSYEEMQQRLGLASKSGIHRLIKSLEERGRIRHIPNRARALEVIDDYNCPLSAASLIDLVNEIERRGFQCAVTLREAA